MKSLILRLFALLLLPFCVAAQVKLEKRSLLDGRVELLVPTYFKIMTPEMLSKKYPSQNKPDLVLTDDDGTVNIVVSLLKQHVQESQIGDFKDFQLNSLKKMRPDSKFLEDGVKTTNGKSIGYFKFISTAIDQKVFNYYFFTSLDGRILLLTFNCTEKLLPEWSETAQTIVSSLTVK